MGQEINAIVESIKNAATVNAIYLFGSFANGTQTENSDLDFYVVVADSAPNPVDISHKIRMAMWGISKRPVDLIVSRESKFEEKKNWISSVEREVAQKGVKVYG